jgi:hypothetical protein
MLLSIHAAAIQIGILRTVDASIEIGRASKAPLPHITLWHHLMTSPLLGIDENEIVSALSNNKVSD